MVVIKEWGCFVFEIMYLVYVFFSEICFLGGDLYFVQLFGFWSDVNCVMFYMLGCYGGVFGIWVVKDLVENNFGS